VQLSSICCCQFLCSKFLIKKFQFNIAHRLHSAGAWKAHYHNNLLTHLAGRGTSEHNCRPAFLNGALTSFARKGKEIALNSEVYLIILEHNYCRTLRSSARDTEIGENCFRTAWCDLGPLKDARSFGTFCGPALFNRNLPSGWWLLHLYAPETSS